MLACSESDESGAVAVFELDADNLGEESASMTRLEAFEKSELQTRIARSWSVHSGAKLFSFNRLGR